ncbi:MAG TPA: PIN domain-containing protein [Candidatus Limnocylindria bacterium]|nr:PIN domain-containing protein [Candidatus Limnocylindria bacterium]
MRISCTLVHTVTTFAYLLENAKISQSDITRHIEWLVQTFMIVPTDEALLKSALKSRIVDYEDAVIERAALQCDSSAIITRNIKDFQLSGVEALTPESYLKKAGQI